MLLTPQQDGGLGFDVRSLQELMAAQALTTGTLEDAVPRLRRIAAAPHWRNTFLFAAGRFFAEPQPHQKQAITQLVRELDQDAPERLGRIFPVGPQLATEMIDDGMATEPMYLHPLVEHALSALHHPEAVNEMTFTRTLMAAAESSPAVRRLIANGLRDALGSTSVPRRAAERVLGQIQVLSSQSEAPPDVAALSAVKRDPNKNLPEDPVADWASLHETLTALADPDTQAVLALVGPLLQPAPARVGLPVRSEDLQIYLSDGDVAAVVEDALGHVASAEPLLIAHLRHDVMATLWRQPLDLDGPALGDLPLAP